MAGKGKNVGKSLVWVLMGLLVLGLGGFGITNLSGRVHKVATVGDIDIGVNTYARTLQNELRARGEKTGKSLSFAQAQAQGVDRQVLGQLVATASLDDEAQRIGISVGDETLRNRIIGIKAFQGPDGKFDRQAYSYALKNAGLKEAEFEQQVRREAARALLQGAVVAGVSMPAVYTDTAISYLAERRDITWSMLTGADLTTPLAAPTTDQLQAYHQTHLPDFTTPETRQITYAWLTPEMMIDTIKVSDADLHAAYDARKDEFQKPERRVVDRLVFPDAAAARAAMDKIANGGSFEDAVAARGLALSDVDMGTLTRDQLTSDAAKAVFAADLGQVAGPVQSALGPALFRVNSILAAKTTSFEDAKPQLHKDLAMAQATRAVSDQMETIDNKLAGGATIEDVARETPMQLGQIAWHNGMSDGIAGYPGFTKLAAKLTKDDYPQVEKLDKTGIFVARLDKIEEPRIRPLSDVRPQVVQGWRKQATVKALEEQEKPATEKLRNGDSFASLNLPTQDAKGLTRRDAMPKAPQPFLKTVFSMKEGAVATLAGDGSLYIIRLDAIAPPDPQDQSLSDLRGAIRNQAASGLAQDLMQALSSDIRSRVPVEIDQQALNAVQTNFN